MREKIELDRPCPRCAESGGLRIELRLVAKPIGSFSLSGAQMKFSVQERVALVCGRCGLDLLGEFDDSAHVVFPPVPAEELPDTPTIRKVDEFLEERGSAGL